MFLYFIVFFFFLDANSDIMAKKSDFTTFRGAFESVMRQHYPSMIGHVAMRLIPCPSICAEGLSVLSKYYYLFKKYTNNCY